MSLQRVRRNRPSPKIGKRYKFRTTSLTIDSQSLGIQYGDLDFWAQNGMICMEDQGSGEFYVVTRREFLERTLSVNGANRREMGLDQRDTLQRVVTDMIECIKEAKHQGDPDDPKVQAWYRRNRPSAAVILGPMPGTREHEQIHNLAPAKETPLVLPS